LRSIETAIEKELNAVGCIALALQYYFQTMGLSPSPEMHHSPPYGKPSDELVELFLEIFLLHTMTLFGLHYADAIRLLARTLWRK